MKDYNILEADYNKALCKTHEEALKKVGESNALLKDCLQSDPFLNQLEESRGFDFLVFALNCNIVAAQVRGEISIALDPEERMSDVVIVSELLELKHPVSALFAKAISDSCYFSAEPVEENGLKVVLYFRFLF